MKVGLILYSVRDEMAKDPIACVKKVGELGYKFIETCNHTADEDSGIGFGVPAKELKEIFDGFGSKVVSAHLYPMEKADLPAVIRYNHEVGNTNIVNPMSEFKDYDDVMRAAETFNKTGALLRKEGLNYLYHNHNHEFRTIHGKPVLELLMENTDPENLMFELDTFWTMRAGLDTLEVLKTMGQRIKLVHQKDFAWDSLQAINLNGLTPEERELKPGEPAAFMTTLMAAAKEEDRARFEYERESAFTEIGCGIMPIQDIIDTANACTQAEYIILEQDFTRMPSQIDSIIKSMEGFKKYSGIEWE